MQLAARDRHLAVLRLAREHHCPWNECICRFWWTPGGVAVGTGAQLPVDRANVSLRRPVRATGGVAVSWRSISARGMWDGVEYICFMKNYK